MVGISTTQKNKEFYINKASEKIAKINDKFRKSRQGFMVARDILALPDIAPVSSMVRDFAVY